MENSKSNPPETSTATSLTTADTRKRAAAAAVALALALQTPMQQQVPSQPPHSAWQITTRAIQLIPAMPIIRSTRGPHR